MTKKSQVNSEDDRSCRSYRKLHKEFLQGHQSKLVQLFRTSSAAQCLVDLLTGTLPALTTHDTVVCIHTSLMAGDINVLYYIHDFFGQLCLNRAETKYPDGTNTRTGMQVSEPEQRNWNRRTHICDFRNGIKLIHWSRDYLSNKWCWKKWIFIQKKTKPKFSPYITPHIKAYLKWIIYL